MLSRNYIAPNQDHFLYRLSTKDYTRIKKWLNATKNNYQPQPVMSNAFEYFPLSYVYSFKRITLEQKFINKNLRTINSAANNGLRILAGVQDQSKNVYVAKLFEKKEIFCHIDVESRTISCLDQIVLAFYTFDERVSSRMAHIGPNLKNFYFVVQFQLISGKGDIFNLGHTRHCLSDRLKQAKIDIQMVKLGQNQKSGHIQFHIDTPEKLGLSYFIPSNCVIDQHTIVPPIKKLQLLNKTTPYIISPHYNISLNNLQIQIRNYDKLIKSLENCSPFFTEYHHDNIKMEILKATLVIGFHNGWKIINDLPGLSKQKDRVSPRHIPTTKNISKVASFDFEQKQLKNNSITPKIFNNTLNLVSIVNQQSQTVNFKPQLDDKSSFILNQSKKEGINLLYFDSSEGHLVAVLQFKIKFKLESTICQQKIVKTHIFWTPITFNTGESYSQVKIPMIQHITLPGHPIQWNKLQQNRDISAQMSYSCSNPNPELHKSAKKDRLNSYSNIRMYTDRDSKEDLIQMLMEDNEQEDDKKGQLQENKQNKLITNNSFITKKDDPNLEVQIMLKKLQKAFKPRLKLKQSKYRPEFAQNIIKSEEKVQGLQLVGKSFNFKCRLRQYLPLTDNLSQFYIPRRLEINIYAFRHEFKQLAYINKDSVKSGIPIQLQNPNKMDYQGFFFNFNVLNISQQEAGAFQETNKLVIWVHDKQNQVFYGSGAFPVVGLFQRNKVTDKTIQQEQQQVKFLRVQIYSKIGPKGNHLRGLLLLQCSVVFIQSNEITQMAKPQQINLSSALKQIPTKQRQLLRIQTFSGRQQANNKRQQIIQKFKQNNHYNFANEVTKKELNNDLVIEYEIGKATYGWLKLNNTDSSGNNVFTFHLDCDFIELVTDKADYQRNSLVFMKSNPKEKAKIMPNLNYVLGKQGSPGYYECKIPQGTEADILVKIFNNQYTRSIKETNIANIEVKRNTFLFKKFKIRLDYRSPLIDRFYHLDQLLAVNANNQIKIRLPQYIFQDNGDYVGTLTINTLYNAKERIISLAKIGQIAETGFITEVLLGIYFDKNCQYLKGTILLHIECLQGEKIKLELGELQTVKIPLCGQNLRIKDKIYRIQISNEQYRLPQVQITKLHYFSQLEKNEPELLLRCLRPKKDDLIISMISLENKLIKKYLIQIQCYVPPRCKIQKLEIQGFVGQKFIIFLQNPYHIDYGFYISSTTMSFMFQNIQFSTKGDQQESIFKLKSRSSIRITVQIVNDILNAEFIVLSDFNHCVVTIYQIKKLPKINKIIDTIRQNVGSYESISRSQTSLMNGSNPAFFGGLANKKVYM